MSALKNGIGIPFLRKVTYYHLSEILHFVRLRWIGK